MRKVLILIAILLLTSCGKEQVFVCDRGELAGEQCIVNETKDVVKTCQPGYEYNEEKDLCVNTLTIDAKPKFICNKGYYAGDNKCISEQVYGQVYAKECISKNIDEDDKLSKTEVRKDGCYEMICEKEAEDGTCAKFKEKKIDFTVSWSCPDGTKKLKEDGECHKVSYQGKKYSCELGTLDGKKCIIEQTDKPTVKCDDDYTLNEEKNICERTVYEKAYLE